MAYLSNNGGYSGDERESRSGDDRPDSDLGDKPIYVVEHLATFTVNKESGITYPADGMRKLLQLEKTTGIWSQKMQLCLDRQWVLIIDYETMNIMERFSVSQIQEPTAFTSQDPMEIYNNILVFIVGGGNPNSRSEMHIFQCQSISAVHLVEDFKNLRSGKLVTQHRETIPPPVRQGPGQGPREQGGRETSRSDMATGREQARDSFIYNQETDSELGGINDETSSTSSEKYERDVTVLNHCFDDIEKFIARLQHAAAAAKELERRRRNRKSKKKDPGEGLLYMRTRPPTEKEFSDIFAKFKLSFNLLAKLKSHIHDPNAPELVHFLFTPLALIVDASHDTYYDIHLPARVIKPLLTREAINLLVNCVTSKETELWRSLGDAWTIPRDQWKGHVGSYHPVFFDGWSPEYPVIDELDNPSTPTNIKKRLDIQHFSSDYDYDQQQVDKIYNPPGSPGIRDFGARSDISIDSIERNGGTVPGESTRQHNTTSMLMTNTNLVTQTNSIHGTAGNESWIDELQSKNAKIVQVTYPRTANNDKELTVVRGEYLEILDDTRKWWKARNSQGQVAHVPHTIVTPYNYNDTHEDLSERYASTSGDQTPSASVAQPADWVRHNHLARENSISTMSSDDETISNHYQPPTATMILPPPPPKKDEQQIRTQPKKGILHNGGSQLPPPPPPMPPKSDTPLAPSLQSRSNTMNSRKSISNGYQNGGGADDMQEELKTVLTLYRDRRKLDIHKTPEIFIQQSASADEVQSWLKAKGFSENVCKKTNGLTGSQLFALKRPTLEEYCGPEEGKRLASQITIQRNVSGYKTARSSELQAILAKARQKFETSA